LSSRESHERVSVSQEGNKDDGAEITPKCDVLSRGKILKRSEKILHEKNFSLD
jgi:hypothetical protein